jgi:hypothetical protein
MLVKLIISSGSEIDEAITDVEKAKVEERNWIYSYKSFCRMRWR